MTRDANEKEPCPQPEPNEPNELNPEKCPLSGITIVEAGAGTGKTYTIQKLALRILLEKQVPLPKILVVTFTVAATGELLERLHAILQLTKDALESDLAAEDIFRADRYEQISGILRNQQIESPDNRKKCLNLVRDALQDYDQAAVMTIHGFCQRMLQDNAMQSFVRYGSEMRTDYSDVDRKIAMDFCRCITYPAENSPGGTISDAMLAGFTITPDMLLKKMNSALSNAFNGAEIKFPDAGSDPADRKALADKIMVPDFWNPLRTLPNDCQLTEGKAFLTQNFADSFPGLADLIVSWIAEGRTNSVLSVAKQLSKEALLNYIRKKDRVRLDSPEFSSFFAALDDLRKCASAAEISIGREFLAFYEEELEKYKAKEGFLTFNDLISRMAKTVDSPQGESLRSSIRNAYSFVFVDEFQDTDPCQYQIFSRIFGNSPDHGFFMIGDPKQAIYSFRGGDVYTYLDAVGKVPERQRYTLTHNYRSGEKYIEALNLFYDKEQQNDPFNNPGIGFSSIVWGKKVKSSLYCNGSLMERPLEFSGQKNQDDLTDWVVSKVQDLLSDGRYSIRGGGENRPVSANDIAILFPNKLFGAKLEKALNAKNIDTVWMSESDIFQLPEAQTVWRFLKMLYDGVRFRDMVAVLSDGLFMFTAKEIQKINSDPDTGGGPGELARKYFLELRKIWEQKGIHALFRKLLNEPNTARKWILEVRDPGENNVGGRFQDAATLAVHIYQSDKVNGPYILGHIRQLADRLHTAVRKHHLTPGGLLVYLRAMINKEPNQEDSGLAQHVQRNTDQPAVRLMTLHASKGLEFPIVLLPNVPTYDNSKVVKRLYHDPDNGNRRTVDMTGWLTGQDIDNPNPGKEYLEEKLRLLYVGLTRAKYACFVPYIATNRAYTEVIRKITSVLPMFPESEITPASPAPEIQEDVQNSRVFNGKFVFDWQNGSFSSFSRGYHLAPDQVSADNAGNAVSAGDEFGGDDERSENDEISAEEPDAEVPSVPDDGKIEAEDPDALPGDAEQQEIFSFARGEKAGTSWHEIFELMELQPEGLSGQDDFIPGTDLKLLEKLPKKSLYSSIRRRQDDDEDAPKRDQAFARMLKGILCNPLTAVGETFCLKDIPPRQCARELGFRYVLKSAVTLKQIKACLEKHHIQTGSWADSAEAEYVDWALTGSLDLLCQGPSGKYYVMDWKTNQLNGKLAGFPADGVQREVTLKMYTLQYLIYTVALWHFIRERTGIELTRENYGRLFGGVFYLFVRGIAAPLPEMTGPQKEICRKRGIFYTLPPFELIDELKQLLDIRSRTNDTERN